MVVHYEGLLSAHYEECPRCEGVGRVRQFTAATFDGIGAHLPAAVEVGCPTCGARMDTARHDGTRRWECPICAATREMDADALIDRLTDDVAYNVRGMPGLLYGACPACDAGDTVRGDPDGDVYCDTTGCGFYAAQYSTEWFAYAAWLRNRPYCRLGPAANQSGGADE